MINFGEFEVYLNDELKDKGHNVITDNGRKWLLDRSLGIGSVLPWNTTQAYIAVGEGSGVTLATMSGLISELGAGSTSRTLFTSVSRLVDAGSTLIGSATFGGSGAIGLISEVAVFVTGYDENTVKTATSTKDTGIMFARRTFDTPHLVNSGTVFNVRYKYTLWNN